MLKRKAYEKLKEWKQTPNKKALCILGARQVGKTTIVREFAKENYSSLVEINFIKDESAKSIFDNAFDANTIITNITAYTQQKIVEGDTLILLDEIQECPNARTAIKFLVEDGRFDYVETGSLLGVKFKEVKSYPVGYEDIYHMYPLDFEEFCWANRVQDETIEYLKGCFDRQEKVSQTVHEVMIKLFRTYVIVGGMPEVTQLYVDTHDIAQVVDKQNSLLKEYRLDITKYAKSTDRIKIQSILDSIPSQLNQKNRRFKVNSLKSTARMDKYDNSFLWLNDAGVSLACYNLEEPQLSFQLNEKHSLFKLFMNDIGLLCAACMENIQYPILQGDLSINLGSVLENAIAQQLKSNGYSLYYYDSKKMGEIDFVIQDGIGVDLLEVKSGNDYKKHPTLTNVLKNPGWSFEKAYVLCGDNIQVEERITYLPWYLVMFIKRQQLPSNTIYEVDVSALMDDREEI